MSLKLQPKASREAGSCPPRAERVYLVDGHSMTFKAYYAIRGLTAPDGTPAGAVYGFLRMLLKIIDQHEPRYLAIVFDTGKPTFRHKLYKAYKANRDAPPEDFGVQMQWIYRLLKALGIATYHLDGYEADDLIATMAAEATRAGRDSLIISADKDLFQLVDAHTQYLRSTGSDLVLHDEAAVEESIGVKPSQVPDWLALVGDSSDNIPGVPSIGRKTATALLQEFESLENLLSHSQEVKRDRTKQALEENAEQARLSLSLATVMRDVPFEFDFEDCRLPESLWNDESIACLVELGFESILKERGLEPPTERASAAEAEEDFDYRLIDDATQLRQWVSTASKARWVALDTETTGLDPMRADLVGLSFSYEPGEAIYIPVGHRAGQDLERQLAVQELKEILEPLLGVRAEGQPGPGLTAQNAKYDWKILERAGFDLAPAAFDTMVASFVLDPGRAGGHGLKSLAGGLCGLPMHPITDIIGSGKNGVSVDEVPPEAIFHYAARDADATLRLTLLFAEKLKEVPQLEKLFYEIEMPLIPVLHKMEMGGFLIDPAQLRTLSKAMDGELAKLTKEIWAEAGREFNIGSPKQLAVVLFEDLALPKGRKTKTGYSTDNSVLENLSAKHRIADLLLSYRAMTKLKSTYADALPEQINPDTGRVHTSFNQTIAQTGRLSSTNPNLQNIPIRSELGREIRRTFIPDSPDHRLLAADYSQIELRLLAHYSEDQRLIEAYAAGEDIHALTASMIFGVLHDDVTREMRAQAKVVNFGIVYGMSAHGLSQRLKIPRPEAARFIEAYFATYGGVKAWIERTLERARKDGYVETLRGRRRMLPDLNSKNGMIRANAERVAVNTPLQGSSADMIKLAMIAVDEELGAKVPEARAVLQVHDELIFSIPHDKIDPSAEIISRLMREALPLKVPIVVDIAVGETWADC